MKNKGETKEAAPSDNKGVNGRTIPKHILVAFDKLVPDFAPCQAKAAVVILKHVDHLLSNHSGKDLPEEVIYIVKRLVSGLVSNRQRVREGFCSTLQGLLQLQPTTVSLTYKSLLELVNDREKLTKEEKRNFLTGELLGYGALIRAGHVKNNSEMRNAVLKRLFWFREKKQYYDILVSHFFVHMMEKFTQAVIAQEVLPLLIPELSVPLEELTPCKLWLRLVVIRKFPSYTTESMQDTLNPKNYATIASIVVKTAINAPNVHPCLGETISQLALQKPKGKEIPVFQFWVKGLVPYLEEPTTNCLQILFNALQLVLLKVKTAEEVTTVCTGEVIAHLLNVMSLHDKNLSASARGVGSALLQLATTNYEQDDSVQLAVAKVLIKKPGSPRFDQLTGTKLLSQMRMHFTLRTMKKISKTTRKMMNDPDPEVRMSTKMGCAYFLGRLVSQPSVSSAEHLNWRMENLTLLMRMALLTPTSEATAQEFQEIFFKCLISQMSRIKDYKVVIQCLIEEADKSVQASKEAEEKLLSPNAQTTWDKIILRMAEIQEDTLPPNALEVFQVLYAQMALYILVDDKAIEIIAELDSCYKKIKKKQGKKCAVSSEGVTDFDPSWVEMVVGFLLNLLPHESSLFRSLAQGVFWLLCPVMTPVALLNIVDVLDPAHEDDLINMEDEDSDEDEDEDKEGESEDEGLDVEDESEEDADEDISDEDASDEDTSDDDDSEEDADEAHEDEEEEEEEDMKVGEKSNIEAEKVARKLKRKALKKLRDKSLKKLKNTMLSIVGNAETDIDMDSVPQEELDRIDEKIGAILGPRLKSSKKRNAVEMLQADEKSIMHFRSRVCDLLQVYLKSSPTMSLGVSLINPLIVTMLGLDQDRVRQEELLNRIRHLLFTLGKLKKFNDIGDATIEYIVEEFNTFFDTCLKMRDGFNQIFCGCYLFFIRCGLQILGEEAHDPNNMLIQCYLSHLRQIFTENKYNIRTDTFLEACRSDWGALWSVADLMKEFSFEAEFKCYWRTQAVQFLMKLYRNEALLKRVDGETFTSFGEDLSSKICQALSLGSTDKTGQYYSEICALLCILHKCENTRKLKTGINWEEIGRVLISIRCHLLGKIYKVCRGPYNNIVNRLGLTKLIPKNQGNVQNPKTKKNTEKSGEGHADGSPEMSNRQKKKKKKGQQKKRKIVDSIERTPVVGGKRKRNALENGDVKLMGKMNGNQRQKKKMKRDIYAS